LITVYEHPLSPFAQKVKIVLIEKGIAFEARMPDAIGSGETGAAFAAASPRGEVPVLDMDGTTVFQSGIICQFIEDAFPDPPLLPATPAARARARMIEEVMDTHYEALTWSVGEVRWFRRLEGASAEAMEAKVRDELAGYHRWLERELGGADWLDGERFGWADMAAIAFVNGATGQGYGPAEGSPLARWQARCNARNSLKACNTAIRQVMEQMRAVAGAVAAGRFRRQYRDHRLEWMVRSGNIDVVARGLETETIRFHPGPPQA
jgi:glutathione S-transferase